MKFISLLVLLAVFAQNILASQEKSITSEPVMKIRFNSTEVSYQNKLGNILEKVFEIDQDAKFLLVAIVRAGANAEDKEFSQSKITEVSKMLVTYGVPEKNIKYRIISDKDTLNNEIHIFLAK
jgi:hypothetical protein